MTAYFSVNLLFSKESYHSTNRKPCKSKESSVHWLDYGSSFPQPTPLAAVKAQHASTVGFRSTIGDREATNTLSGATGQHRLLLFLKDVCSR